MQLLYEGNHPFGFIRTRNLDFQLHLQNSLELVFLQKGICHIRCGGLDAWLQPGQLLAVFPHQIHSYDSSRDVEAVLLVVPIQPYLSAYTGVLFGQVPEDPRMESEYLLPLVDMMLADVKTATETVMQGYLQVLVGKLLQSLRLRPAHRGQEEVLHKLLTYLEDHYRENLNRKTVARTLGYSESYLSHVFSEALGITMPEYVNTLRVREAMNLLRRTDQTVTDLSARLGFGSIRSFNRVFKKETGMTPACWRKK